MNILFLAEFSKQKNGYTIVGENLCHQLARHEGVKVDTLYADDYRSIVPKRTSLKSPLFQRFGYLAIIFDFFLIAWVTRRQKYDLIHCNLEHYAPVAMLLGLLWRIPFTVTAHGTYSVVLPSKSRLFSMAFKKAACVIAVSSYTRQRINENGLDTKCRVITNGVDLSLFRPDHNIVKEDIVLFVGNAKQRKGFSFLYEALRIVTNQGGRFKLVVVSEFGETHRDICSNAAEDAIVIEFTGKLSDRELVDYYRRAKINVLPSFSAIDNFEGFGLIHVEAISCGTLTVGCKNSGNVDAIQPGNGYLLDYGNTNELARVILRLLTTSVPSDLVPQGIIPRDWTVVANDYLEVFESTID
ncbi:MAG TPA: hypothetical protein DIS62_00615 [Candidatus Kerfeldbacteria bacterium]|nr:hypothetical protein [Candidatus Kerfeldbacteria bacterium]